jgi:hypothetical protein
MDFNEIPQGLEQYPNSRLYVQVVPGNKGGGIWP